MLIIKLFINKEQLHDIYVHNTGMMDVEGNHIYNVYKNIRTAKNGRVTFTVKHKREDGAISLTKKVMEVLEKKIA